MTAALRLSIQRSSGNQCEPWPSPAVIATTDIRFHRYDLPFASLLISRKELLLARKVEVSAIAITPFDAARFIVGEVETSRLQGQEYFDKNGGEMSEWNMKKTGVRPNGIIGCESIELVESHYANWATEPLLSLARNFRHSLGGVHAESRGEHCGSVLASSTAKLQDVGLGWQHAQKRLEEAAGPIGAARRISWSLRRIEPQSNGIKRQVVGRRGRSAGHVYSPYSTSCVVNYNSPNVLGTPTQ